ncbi:cation:proton antiporter regulatory subunit [Nocardioides pacificus]
MDVTEILLPGVGVVYEFETVNGVRTGVVARRDGAFDLLRYERRDPDAAETLLSLTRDEAETLAGLLGAPRIVEKFADLTREIPGLVSATVDLPARSPYDGASLGDTRCRTQTGASIVAIVRGDGVLTSPGPDERLRAGDSLVVIGTRDAIDAVRHILLG